MGVSVYRYTGMEISDIDLTTHLILARSDKYGYITPGVFYANQLSPRYRSST
jgi:hypothetical protein